MEVPFVTAAHPQEPKPECLSQMLHLTEADIRRTRQGLGQRFTRIHRVASSTILISSSLRP